MSNVLEGTQLGQELLQRGEARGEARGRAEALRAMLVDRFGDVPGLEELAVSLVGGGDLAASVQRIRAATSPQDLTG